MSRDEAVDVVAQALEKWHDDEHGERCCCPMHEFGQSRAAAAVDALVAQGVTL